jgi:hypothetical protein
MLLIFKQDLDEFHQLLSIVIISCWIYTTSECLIFKKMKNEYWWLLLETDKNLLGNGE